VKKPPKKEKTEESGGVKTKTDNESGKSTADGDADKPASSPAKSPKVSHDAIILDMVGIIVPI